LSTILALCIIVPCEKLHTQSSKHHQHAAKKLITFIVQAPSQDNRETTTNTSGAILTTVSPLFYQQTVWTFSVTKIQGLSKTQAFTSHWKQQIVQVNA